MNTHENARLAPLHQRGNGFGGYRRAHVTRPGARVYGVCRKIGSRRVGLEYVHICTDDASRLAFTNIFPDEKAVSAIAFLKAAIAYYESLAIAVTRVMTDNGACYRAKNFAKTCKDPRLKHIRTKPDTPKTNGKAERFIQTALKEWAYACAYPSSEHRKSICHTGRICIIGTDRTAV